MPKERGLSAGIAAVVLTVVIANLGNNIVAPLMPALKEHFGSAAQIALVASGFGLGRLVMDLPAGVLIDRVSPTRMFTAGILLSGAAAAMAAFSTTLEQLIFFRTAMGFGSAIMSTVALTLLARIAPPGHQPLDWRVPGDPFRLARGLCLLRAYSIHLLSHEPPGDIKEQCGPGVGGQGEQGVEEGAF